MGFFFFFKWHSNFRVLHFWSISTHLHEDLSTGTARPHKTVFDVTVWDGGHEGLKQQRQGCECNILLLLLLSWITMWLRWQWSAGVPLPLPSGWLSAQHTLSGHRRRSPRCSLEAKTHTHALLNLILRDKVSFIILKIWLSPFFILEILV